MIKPGRLFPLTIVAVRQNMNKVLLNEIKQNGIYA
jgi:hypothetical protein